MRIDDEMLVELGARLQLERKKVGFSQSAMASAIGVSPRAYHAYEKGKRSIPIEALVSFIEQFEIDPSWILRGVRSTSTSAHIEKLERFLVELDEYLELEQIKLSALKRAAIVRKWYRFCLDGRDIPMGEIQIWLDLLKE